LPEVQKNFGKIGLDGFCGQWGAEKNVESEA